MSQFGGGGGKPNAWGRPGAGGTQLPGFGSLGGVGGFPMMGMGMPMINQNAFQQQGMMSMGVMGAVPQQQGRLPQQQQPQNTTSTLGSSSAVTNKNRAFVGVVTKMHDSYGFVDDDVFFQHTVIRGAHPRVGDKVMVEASYNPQMPFKWNAYRVQLLTGPGSGGGDMLPHQSARGPSPINMGGMQNQRNSGPNIQSGGPGSRWGPGGAQERNGPPRSSPPRRRSPPRRSPAPRRPSPARAGPPPGRRKTRTPPPRRASPPPVRRASPPAVRDRKRERSLTNSVAPSLKRDSASPPRRRARIIPRYECRPTKPVLTSDQVSVVQVRSRYSKLYVPSDFADFSPEWSKRVPLDANIDLSNPVSFHIWNKDVDYILEDGEPETVLDAEDADNRHQVKVLLLSHAGKVEVLKKAFGLLPDGSTDDTHEVTSVFKQLQFLVGCRGKELMAVGGCWSPSLDGVDPTNPATLIKTAIRTTKALTGLDLSNSPQWYSMVQVRYYRADKDRVDRVHLLWPDTQLLMPETATWEGQGAALAAQLEKKLAAVDAMSLKEEKEVEQPVATPVPAKESLVQHQAVHSTEFCEDVEAEKEVKKDDLPASILTPSKDSDCDTSMTDKPKPNATHWNDLDVKTMKVAELKAELEARGLETKGIKTMLAQRLQEVLDKEQELEEDGPPDSEDIVMKDETGEDEHEVDAEVVEVKVEHDVPVKSEEDLKKDAEELQKRVEKLEKEKKERKIALEKHYTMPKDIKAMVYPSKTAKSGKFDCKIVSLQTLLEYRQDDNKESQFEVSLFAEAFKEMLERQAAFTIYQSITIAGEKDCERKKRDEAKGRGEKEKSESQDGKDKSEPEKKEEEKPLEKVELKSVVSNRALFEACAMFDINLCSYITERDLEEILYNGEFGITRGQVTRLAHKLCSRDRINYRNLTDNLVDSEGNVKYTPGYCDGAPDVDVLMKGFGLNYTIAENLQWNGNATIDFVHSSSSDGTIVINGNVINVSQKLALLKKSEQERDSAKASLHEQTSLIAQLREFKQELEKKKRDLEKELDKTKKKLTDTGSALKTSIEDGAHLRSAIADVRRYAERTLTVVDKACPPPSPRKEEKEKKSDEKQPKNSTIEKEDEEIPADALVLSDEAGPDAEITDPETPANGVEVPLNPSVSVNGESPTVTNTPGEHSLATEPDVVLTMDPQSSALRERVTGETDSGGDLIYCICRTTKSDGFMICCEKCSEWFHGTCIAITEEFAKNIHQYNCDLCVSKCADLEKIIYRKRYLKELDRLKQETEIMDSLKCGECIQCCYNKKGCEKCDGCLSIPPGQCVKRRCVQAEILYKEQKGAVGRPRREVSTKSADDSDDSPLSPGVPHAVDVHSPPEKEKGKRGRKKGWRKDQQLQPQQVTSSVKVDDPEKLKKEVDLNKDPEIDQEIARSVYDSYTRRRGGRQSKNELKAIQCLGPECQRQTRENSKYCSDECGRKLAKARLLTILPGRVDNFWATAPRADVRAAEQIRELDQIADNLQCRVGKLLEYIAMIHKFLQAMKDQEPLGLDDKEVTEGDVVSNCTICGLEFSSRQLSKHVERCFVRAEKQQTFGMPTKCPFNPNELFCDSFNKGTNTYCKRLRVLCPEHYKGDLEADMKVCGCPNVWMKTTSQTFEDIFISTEYFLNEKFCMLPRKDCLQHHRWIQVIIGLVESERMNVLTRRSEILERRMAIRLANEMRGNAIVLLNSGTVNVEPDNNNKTEIS